jgi:hypothetical protein
MTTRFVSPPSATPPQEHVARLPVPAVAHGGVEAQVVPGAPCGRLLPSPGHELHCAVGAHTRTDLAGIGEGGLGSIVASSTARVDGCVARGANASNSPTIIIDIKL